MAQPRKTDTVFVYMTAKDEKEARKVGKALVEDRLAACANIIPNMKSLYWWDGKIQDDSEAVLIVKSKKSLMKKLIARMKSIHSYKVPCIVALPIVDGNQEFLEWIDKETA
jgi:periplasmic divalent cation tolerance protein